MLLLNLLCSPGPRENRIVIQRVGASFERVASVYLLVERIEKGPPKNSTNYSIFHEKLNKIRLKDLIMYKLFWLALSSDELRYRKLELDRVIKPKKKQIHPFVHLSSSTATADG